MENVFEELNKLIEEVYIYDECRRIRIRHK